ncbi:MAG TPA: SapC family protein [Acetobacteraceae bacterium]|jgi:hypothetical protein|nr:SapC family protein [Acetobacteraceae bacterium]
MSNQLLFYKTAVPITRARHFDCSLASIEGFEFSQGINSVPLTGVEFPMALAEYPIIFAGSPGEIAPAVILGLGGTENLFLAPDYSWMAKYIPAFIRRYPFVFSRADDRFLLCVDEEYAGFNRDGLGQQFFTPEGEMAPLVQNVLAFVQEYQAQFTRTQMFCAKVEKLGILEPMQAQVTVDGVMQNMLGGFQAVSREKLKALPGDTLAELAATDELELIYLHLQSMRNFEALRDRMVTSRQRTRPVDEPQTEPEAMPEPVAP